MGAFMTIEELKQCQNIEDLAKFVSQLTVQTGFLGGRTYTLKNQKDSVSYDDITGKLQQLYRDKVNQKPLAPSEKELTQNIIQQIRGLNTQKSTQTAASSWFNWMAPTPQKDKLDEISEDITTREAKAKEEFERLQKLPMKELMKGVPTISLPDLTQKMITSGAKSEQTIENVDQAMRFYIAASKVMELYSSGKFDELRDLFKGLDPDQFVTLASILATKSMTLVAFTTQFLESLQWPTPELKEEKLPVMVALALESLEAIQLQYQIFHTANDKMIPTFQAYMGLKKIFGTGDLNDINSLSQTQRKFFTLDSRQKLVMSPYLAKGIALAFKDMGNTTIQKLQENFEKGKIDEARLGLEIRITQSRELRFPASILSPILPHLKNVPALMALYLDDIGVKGPFDSPVGVNQEKDGFRGEDAQALLDIIKENPYLQNVKININGMKEEEQQTFLTNWGKILEEQGRKSPKELFNEVTNLKLEDKK